MPEQERLVPEEEVEKELSEPALEELFDACGEYLTEEDKKELEGMDFDDALGAVFGLLLKQGVEDPEEFLKEKGILE